MSPHESDVIRYHTAGRRQPQLIGKDPSGVPIWGAPYTLYQVAGLATIPIMWQTRGIWAGQLSGIAAIAVIAMTTAAVIWLLGRIDFSGRNVIYAAGALANAWLKTIRRGPHIRRNHPGTRITVTAFHPSTTRTRPPAHVAVPAGRPAPATPAAEPGRPTPSAGSASVQPVGAGAAPATRPLPVALVDLGRLSPLEAFLAAANMFHVGAQ